MSTIDVSNRRVSRSARVEKDPPKVKPWIYGRNELDSLADTSCAGKNWRPLEFTGILCDVSGFQDEKESASKSIPVATCATVVVIPETGAEIILIGHEMLYFGDKLSRSLINQNQVRYSGIPVRDDPTRANDEEFGLTTPEGFIDFKLEGMTVYFDSRTPTDQELEDMQLPQVAITREEPWDPKGVDLRSICKTTSHHQFHIEHETDLIMGQLSTCYTQDPSEERVLSKVYTKSVSTRDTRHSKVTPAEVSRTLGIGLETATKTLNMTTQRGIRTAIHPITRRYRVDHLALNRKRLNDTFHTDTLKAGVASINGNKYAQVFTNGKFTTVAPMKTRSEAGEKLKDFIDDIGVPHHLTADQAGEHHGPNTVFQETVRRHRIIMKWVEKGRHTQNHRAEREIGILRQRWRLKKAERNIPSRLWDYGMVYEGEVLSRISRGITERPGLEEITGETVDLSEWLDFSFYDIVWYHDDPGTKNDDNSKHLGRWLGISHRVGSLMCYWILTKSGHVVSRTTVQHVLTTEAIDPVISQQIDDFNKEVNKVLRDEEHFINEGDDPGMKSIDKDEDWYQTTNNDELGTIPTDEEYGDMSRLEKIPEADNIEETDQLIGASINLERGNEQIKGTVIKRARGMDGNPIGRKHVNPMFDTREYEVRYTDGSIDILTTNTIVANMFARVDSEGQEHAMLKEIVSHRKNNSAIEVKDGFITSRNGNKIPKRTTQGWEIAVEWRGGDVTWLPLKDVKNSNPVELAEYATNQGIDKEPAFNWWVKDTLLYHQRIIKKIKKKYWRTTSKFGIRLPKTVKEALEIDRETRTTFWRDAIEKELRKVKVAWERRDDLSVEDVRKGTALIGHKEIQVKMVFDVKMDFTRKARLVAGGHLTDHVPSSLTYSSVVTRDSVRLAFLIAELNQLEVLAGDISNAYLNAPCKEKIWFLGGDDVGKEDQGKVCVMVRALYGLKSSGASWHATLAELLRNLGFEDTKADPDVWRRPSVKENGDAYYELVLIYVDDILIISKKSRKIMEQINESFEVKPESIGPPSTYLGAQIYRHNLPDGRQAWGMTSEKYIKNAIRTVEDMLDEDGDGCKLKTTAKTALPTNYRPELESTPELNATLLSRYRQLIGILRWAVELGRVDIYVEVALLSQYLASPREGHLQAVYHIFSYLRRRPVAKMVFDPIDVSLDESAFHDVETGGWYEYYGHVSEELPPRMPVPLGKPVQMTCFVDSDHAGNLITRRSHTGIIIFVQNAPIIWYSKRQNTVESSTFGSEFVALRTARDLIVSLRFKLRMFGVPLVGPTDVLCDNAGVVKNTSVPESVLSKRHNAINYHVVRESAAAGILRVGKEDGETNLADAFTKILPRDRRINLFSKILYSRDFIHDDLYGGDVVSTQTNDC